VKLVMKFCPASNEARHSRLGDDRFQYRACGRRFSWSSVWDAAARRAGDDPQEESPGGRTRPYQRHRMLQQLRQELAVSVPVRPRQYVHLYLAEIRYRYNRRDEDLIPLIFTLLKHASTQEPRPISSSENAGFTLGNREI